MVAQKTSGTTPEAHVVRRAQVWRHRDKDAIAAKGSVDQKRADRAERESIDLSERKGAQP